MEQVISKTLVKDDEPKDELNTFLANIKKDSKYRVGGWLSFGLISLVLKIFKIYSIPDSAVICLFLTPLFFVFINTFNKL